MATTRVFALDLGACFSGLLHHQVQGLALHDGFDVRLLVARDQYEARDVRRDPVIVCRRELDPLDATFGATLTMEGQQLVDTVLFGTFFDPLVDGAKHLFVVRRSFREIHREDILPRSLVEAKSD